MSIIPTRFFVTCVILAAMLGLFLPTVAMTHPLHDGLSGFVGGMLHPLIGLDHLIALLAIGIWCGEQQKQNRWWIPLTFLLMMMLGAIVGMQSGAVIFNEHFIVSSVLVFGGITTMLWQPTLTIGLPILSIFAIAHGAAHGAEMPTTISPFGFILGFLLAAAGVIATGFVTGQLIRRIAESKGIRVAGIAIIIAGCFLLFL